MSSKREIQPYKIRGIDALFGETTLEPPKQNLTVDLDQIVLPQHQQPRRYFDPTKQKQLEQSIQEHGILEPLLVRSLDHDGYELVAGERRYRAAKALGLTEVPVIIKELTDRQAYQLSLVENLQREDLNPVEETEGVLQLLALELDQTSEEIRLFLYQMKNGIEKLKKERSSEQFELRDNVIPNPNSDPEQKVEQVFKELAKSWYSFTCNRLPLLNLPDDVLEVLRQGRLEYTKARAIARLADESTRVDLLQEAIDKNLPLTEIKEKIKLLTDKPESPAPKQTIQAISQQLKRSKLWETDPKKWGKVEKLLGQINNLLNS